MLDDVQHVQGLDKGNALGVVAGQPGQLKQQFDPGELTIEGIKQIVVAGMGGSALGAEFVKNWLSERLELPLIIVRDYALPAFVGPQTLVVASSYSGNTEETLEALEDAQKRQAQIAIVTAGGKLEETAREKGYPLFAVPGGLQPRLAVLYGARALAQLLESLGLGDNLVKELEEAADWITPKLSAWTLDNKTADNQAKQIAEKLSGFPVVVYGGPTLALPTMKWKIDINENGKNVAFWNLLPEFNHNEFIGWLNPAEKQLRVVELQSSLDHPQIAKRFEVSNRLLSGKMPSPVIVTVEGETKLQQMLWSLLLGDFVSAYVGILNGIDPTPVDLVEKMKDELA